MIMKIFNFQFSIFNNEKGQAMLLTVLVLGASILAASTIAGYLTLLKIRTSSDIANSAKAIFAADSGVEWELYKQIKHNPLDYSEDEAHSFSNHASFKSSYDDTSNVIKSIGESGDSFRAFAIGLEGATMTLPE